jgi:translation initiation factor IF-3
MIAISSEYRINEEITQGRCRLIGADGEQLGIFEVRDALRKADDSGYDLVEIAPQADPPVCKIMDYGKFRYEQSMKAKQARKHQQKIEIKEMKFRPKVDIHDYNTKKKHILRFLDAGAKVKVTIMFRGREMAHPELGLNILVRLAEELEDLAVIENQPKLEGRNMHMLISPLKKKPEKSSKESDKDGTDTDTKVDTETQVGKDDTDA